MKPFIMTNALYITALLPSWAAHANTAQLHQPHAQAYESSGHDSIGKPSDGSLTTRTIEITIKETSGGYMLFEPNTIQIKKGSVVRFVVDNLGALDHEFLLSSFDGIAEHRQWMRRHPDMQHEDKNALTIPSGQKVEFVWEFSNTNNLEFVCLIPGHREAGMWGVIMVHDRLAPRQ